MMTESAVDILIVEDNPNDVELLLRVFKWYSFSDSIYVVGNGEEALEFIYATGRYAGRTTGIPKMILLDLKLPGMDGIEVLRRIKGDPATRAVPVVMLTSSNEDRDIVESYNLGVNSYIVKPVQFYQFVDSIKQLGAYWRYLNQQPGKKQDDPGQAPGRKTD